MTTRILKSFVELATIVPRVCHSLPLLYTIACICFGSVVSNAHEDLLCSSSKQSQQTAYSFTGVPSSLVNNPKCHHTWFLPVGLHTHTSYSVIQHHFYSSAI